MINLRDANIGDIFCVLEINAPMDTKQFLKTLNIDNNKEIIIRGEGYFPNTMLVDVDGRIIQLDNLTISQINGEIVKVKKLVK